MFSELNDLKGNAKAFNAALGKLLKAKHDERRARMAVVVKKKPKKTVAKKSGK